MGKILAVFFSLFAPALAFSETLSQLVDGRNLSPQSLEQITTQIPKGAIVIISEHHGFALHHDNQSQLLQALAPSSNHLSVGLEFLAHTVQGEIDRFLAGQLGETDFLAAVEWGSIPFEFYRNQVLFPRQTGGQTLGLNAPNWLARRISSSGLDSLSEAERQLLPPNFALGNAEYRERFREVMKDHVPAEKLERYFEAQSLWDDRMAETACVFQRQHPDRRLVILVGDFHAAYGGGLPDRLRARGCTNLKVISQVEVQSLARLADETEVAPHPRWGFRADWVWAALSKKGVRLSSPLLKL